MKKRPFPKSKQIQKGRPKKLNRKLKNHLQAIANEVTWLNHYYEIFLEYNDIVKQSPVNTTTSQFWDFMQWAAIGELVHRIDRICEKQWPHKSRKVHSLGAFLEDIRPFVDLLNRSNYVGATPNTIERYKAIHPGRDEFLTEMEFYRLNHELESLIGKTKFSLGLAQLERDRTRLKKTTLRISRYRNKHLAHMAIKKGRMKIPNLKDIDAAIKYITKLTHKYYLLTFVGSHVLQFGNVDITSIFMRPWILNQQNQMALRNSFNARQR